MRYIKKFLIFIIFVTVALPVSADGISKLVSQYRDMLQSVYPIYYNDKKPHCHSFRIHKHWLLTAAHCLNKLIEEDGMLSYQITPSLAKERIKGIAGLRQYGIIFEPLKKDSTDDTASVYFINGSGKLPYFATEESSAQDLALIRLNYENEVDVEAELRKNISAGDISSLLKKMPKMQWDFFKTSFFRTPVSDFKILTGPSAGSIQQKISGRDMVAFPLFLDEKVYIFTGEKSSDGYILNTLSWATYETNGLSGSSFFHKNILIGTYWGGGGNQCMLVAYDDKFKKFIYEKMGKEAAGIKFIQAFE